MAIDAAPEPTTSPAVSPRALSAELAALEQSVAGKSVELRAVLEALQGRAYELLMILLVLPFAVPVAVPGMSTPLGIAICGIALQLALGRLPWLPRRLLAAKLPAGFLDKVLAATRGVVRYLEKFLRPRMPGLTRSRALVGLHLWGIALAGFLIALPLPIPFTNMIPGWAVLLIAMGLMERDGLFIAAGHVVLVISVAYFALIGGSAQHTVEWAIHWVQAWLAR